jgi:hypothetical protein
MKNAISINNVKALALYEQGQLDEIQSLLLFSGLIESGLINQLRPIYRETANALIAAGFLNFDGTIIT